MESSPCDYSNAYVLVTGDVTVKNCAPFKKCRAEVNSTFVDEADLSILQCLCTIWLNTAIIVWIPQEVHDSLKGMR